MKKRILSVLLTATLMASLTVQALAAETTFTDVSADKWYYTWVTKAAQAGWVSGVGGGKYEPGKSVTYSQFAVMLDRALYSNEFDAQPKGDYWWTPACEVADKHGLFADTDMANRSDWTEVANKPIEREQMAQMMYNALVDVGAKLPTYEEYSEVSLHINDIIDCENDEAVAVCYTLKLLTGTGNGYFDPRDPMTRAQAAVVLCNIYGYVTGDVTGSTTTTPNEPDKPSEPEKPTQPDVPRPAGAVGGRYDVSVHDVPADTNKDGWITEAEVQAVLNQLRVEYPHGSEWGLYTRYPGRPDGKGMGSGTACAGFAKMVSDRIFGTLPYYTVALENSRVGDIMMNDQGAGHDNIVLNDYGKDMFEGVNYTDSYTTVDGNSSGTVYWGGVHYYADWPTGVGTTRILSRYPQE